MTADLDDLPIFRPKFGRRDRAGKSAEPPRFRNLVFAIMRGGAIGRARRLPISRARIAVRSSSGQARRVIVKVHVAPLRAGGAKAAALHLRYIERDGVEKDGSPGVLYGAEGPVLPDAFEAPRLREKHQFRVIVSPEDADELDLSAYVRRLMAQMQKDLGQRLEWAAVNHFDTDHPHAHIVIRGVDREGREVRLPRAYVAHGLRDRAQELATDELGPRPERDVARQRRREVTLHRFTTLDRELEKRAVGDRIDVRPGGGKDGRARENESLLLARLEHLERLNLAEKISSSSWALAQGWKEHLRELGMRGDIIKEMHRALRADPARYRIVKAGQSLEEHQADPSPTIQGRVVKKGLSDELRGSFYAIVETPSGGGYHVPLDRRAAEEVREGEFVVLQTKRHRWRRAEDRDIERIAMGQGGVYDPEVIRKLAKSHAKDRERLFIVDLQYLSVYRSGGSQGDMPVDTMVNAHVRRLGELEKLGLAAKMADGKWAVQPDLVEKLDAKDEREPRRRLVVERQALGLAAQVRQLGPVWLDRLGLDGLAPYGLGAEVRKAIEERQKVLRLHGIDPADPRRIRALRQLERRELGRRIAEETGAKLVERIPANFRGQVRIHARVDAGDGSYAEIREGGRFVLIPATRELRALSGRSVSLSRDADGRMSVRSADRDRSDS
jgi:type IV secretory pathway VirD2 relaxase